MQSSFSYVYRPLVALTCCILATWNITGIFCCQNDPSLYFIDDHTIKCAAVDSLDQPDPNFQTVVSNLAEGTAIDIDVRNKMIYWSDTHAWTINRMNLTSGEVKVIIKDNIGEVFSIAVEWESGLIYWTDFIFERIEVAKLNGSSRRTIITQDVKSPMGIAVDPGNGYVVWADHNYTAPKIMRADLTGENHQELYTTFHGLPLYVVIDHSENRVYWTDIHFFYTFIGSIGIDGNAYQGLGYLHPVYYPFDLAIFQNNFYWADQNLQGVSWFNFKSSSPTVSTLQNVSPYIVLGVTISDPSTQPIVADQPCAVNNGNCSHLCLLTPGGGRKCACPQGVDLSVDGTTCSNDSAIATQPPPLPAVKVRLVGSSLASSGRVEVLYNGQWGTVCDDYWGIAEAHVICRMLNYSGAELAPLNARFGQGSASMPILLDNVKCRGDESTIAACRHGGWGQNDCDHSEDASVVCWRDSAPPVQAPTLAPGPHPELQVRLYGGDTHYQGGVEIYLNGTWGTICDDSWGIEEANVICRMLNFTEGALSTQCCGFYNGYGVANQIWLDDVHCVGDEQSIAECRHAGFGRHNCRHTEDVGVVCKHTPISPPSQIVRLVDGARESEGRVEIFNDGEWGTVCDDHWDINDANVVCKMLNYSRALRAPGKAFFGRGNGKIWLGSVNCRGNEISLLQCGQPGWNVDSCDHHEDASVICESEAAHLESNSFILACGSGRSLLYHIPLDTNLAENGLPLALLTNKPLAVTFHSKEQMAYWTEQSGSIVRAHLNGSSREVIATGLTRPTGIAIDYISQILYIADQTGIKVSRLDGSYQVTLINSSEACHGIALDSEAGHIYYTLIGVSSQIRRADMDGRNVIILVNVTSIRRTTLDIALDKVKKRLYFSDESNNRIKYLDLASFQTHSLLSRNPRRPVGLTLFNGTLHWTGVGAAEMFSGAIYKADVKDVNITSPIREVVDLLSYPTGLYAHDATISESPAFNHSCAQGNGGCSHLCLINPSGYKCVCPGGPCQTRVTSSVSTTSSVNRVAVRSSSSSLYVSVSSSSSAFSSLSTPYLSMAISSPSIVNSSPTKLLPTTTSSVNSISKTSSPVAHYCSTNDPCENGGSCQMDGLSYTCVCIEYFYGQHCSINYRDGTVVIIVSIPGNQLNVPELTDVIVQILNILCEGESNRCPIPLSEGTRRKRETNQVTFKPEDVIVMEPKPVKENLRVELAVVKTMPDGSFVVISSEKLTQILRESVDDINQRLNGTIINIVPKFPGPATHTTPNREKTTTITPPRTPIVPTPTQTTTTATPGTTTRTPAGPGELAASVGGSNGGVIGGVVVAVLVIVIIVIALAVWYFRVKIPSLPFSYTRKTNVPGPGPRVAAFENPGYDNTPGFATGDDGLYSDLPQPVVLSPYEDLTEFGAASNPIYSEYGMTKLASQDKRGGSVRSDIEKNMFGSQPRMSWVDNEDPANGKGNDGGIGSNVSLQSSDSIKRAKANQVGVNVPRNQEETDIKESAMVPHAVVRKDQENKGQTVLFLEPGEELEKASEM